LTCLQTGSQACIFVQAGAAAPDKQPNNMAATIPTPRYAPVGAGKAVPAFPSPAAKGMVSSGKATLEASTANASIPGKGAPSVAQALPASPPAAGSSQVIHNVLILLLCSALLHSVNPYLMLIPHTCALQMCWTWWRAGFSTCLLLHHMS
jgi:hypothetical protein